MLLGLDRYDTSTQRGEDSRAISDVCGDVKNQVTRLNPTSVEGGAGGIVGTPNHRIILGPPDSSESTICVTSD